jgi:hypothetical protein
VCEIKADAAAVAAGECQPLFKLHFPLAFYESLIDREQQQQQQ